MRSFKMANIGRDVQLGHLNTIIYSVPNTKQLKIILNELNMWKIKLIL